MAKVTITLETAANITDAELADLMRESMAQGEIQSVYRDDDLIDCIIVNVQETPVTVATYVTANTIAEATHRYPTSNRNGAGYFGDGWRYLICASDEAAESVRIGVAALIQRRNASGEWETMK